MALILLRPSSFQMKALDTVIKENSIECIHWNSIGQLCFSKLPSSILKTEGNNFVDLLNTLDRLGYHVQTEARKPIKDLEAYLANVPLSFGINLFATHADR